MTLEDEIKDLESRAARMRADAEMAVLMMRFTAVLVLIAAVIAALVLSR